MSSKMFGYARVSTAEQNEDRQITDLLACGIDERDKRYSGDDTEL